MTTFREVIEVPTPLPEAFSYVADFTTAADWDPGIVSSTRTSGDGGVGTAYAVEAAFRGRTLPFSYVVTEHEPEHRLVLRGEGDKATSEDVITFAATDAGGTRITYEADLRFKGAFRVVEPFMGGAIRKMGAKALAGLEAALSRSPS